MKKYFTDKFNQTSGFDKLSFTQKFEKFHSLLKVFVDDHFGCIFSENSSLNTFEFQNDVLNYVGILINPTIMKKNLRNKRYAKFLKLYYDCVYKYSHRKLNKLFTDSTLKLVFNVYSNSGAAEMMIEHDETLSKSKETYMK